MIHNGKGILITNHQTYRKTDIHANFFYIFFIVLKRKIYCYNGDLFFGLPFFFHFLLNAPVTWRGLVSAVHSRELPCLPFPSLHPSPTHNPLLSPGAGEFVPLFGNIERSARKLEFPQCNTIPAPVQPWKPKNSVLLVAEYVPELLKEPIWTVIRTCRVRKKGEETVYGVVSGAECQGWCRNIPPEAPDVQCVTRI